MKVMLVVPPWTILDIRAHDTQGIAGKWPPIGTLYIASVLREDGFNVVFKDGAFYTHDELVREIHKEKPDALGAFVIAMFWERAQSLFRDVKKVLPNCYIFAGGHGPSAFGTKALKECRELDAVVFHEGEFSTRDLMRRLLNKESTIGVEGTAVRENDEIVENPKRPYIDDLDSLPFPAMDLAYLKGYRPSYGQVLHLPSLQLQSSRGCMNDCLYCYRLMGRNVLRFRSPRNVVDEIEFYVKKFNARDIKFWDESFTYDKNRTIGICEEILKRGIKVSWWVSARADSVDAEMLRFMKKAGCWCINYGVESAVQKNLDTLRKNLTVDQIVNAVNMTHRAGIKTFTTYIFGIPGETFEEGLKTIELAKKLNSHITEFFPISPFPGTDLWDLVCQSDRFKGDIKKIGLLKEEIEYAPDTMTHAEVAELRRRAFKEYYIRPAFVWRYVTGIRSMFELKGLFAGAMTLLKFTRKKDNC